MNKRKPYRTSIPALVLLFIYLLNPVKLSLPYLDYNLNYEYIKNFLCENKDKPAIKCEGKCYLSKALKANQDKQQTNQRLTPKNYFVDEITLEDCFAPLRTFTSTYFISFYLEDFIVVPLENSSPPPKAIV